MKDIDLAFNPHHFNWKKRLEQLFPQVPSRNDRKTYSDFLDLVHENYLNHKAGKLGNKEGEFSWFYQVLKIANKKLREENIFIIWLWLCISRPWQNKNKCFFLEWGPGRPKDFDKVLDILVELESKYKLNFYSACNASGFKTFYRYKKNDLVRMIITGLFTIGYSNFISSMEFGGYAKRFNDLLKSGTLITKREFQRKLRIKSDLLDLLIKEAENKELIKIMKLSKNSIGIFYIDPIQSKIRKNR